MKQLTQIHEWNMQLEAVSPLHIGDEDGDILVDQDNKPFIPGTSLAGVCRAYLETSAYHYLINDLFGESATYNPHQGLIISDGHLHGSFQYDIRPSVSMSGNTGAAKDGSFFERTFISAGAIFDVTLTLKVSQEAAQEQLDAIDHLLNAIHHGVLRIGALRSIGGGQMEISSCQHTHYDCTKEEDLNAYVRQSKTSEAYSLKDNFQPQATMQFTMKGKTATPLLIATANTHASDKPDILYMKTNEGEPLIPGSSLKGLLRHRVERIANVLALPNASTYIEKLFGQDSNTRQPQAAALQFQDTKLEKTVEKIYYRTAINPLTGSVKDGALLDEETVSGHFTIQMHLSYAEKNEDLYISAALLLFALRDLALQQLSIGSRASIGYGFVDVDEIKISMEEAVAKIDVDKKTIDDSSHLLKTFDEALRNLRHSQEVMNG